MANLFLGYGASTENLEFVTNAIRCSGSDPADSSNTKSTSSSTTSTSTTYLDSILECHQIYSDKQCCNHQDGEKYFHNYLTPLSDDGSIERDDDVAIEDRNNKKLIAISQSKEAIKMKSLLQHDHDETMTPEARMLFQACIRELVLDNPLNAKKSPASANSDSFHSDPWWKKLVSEFQSKANHPLPSKKSNERKEVKPIAKDGNAQVLQSKDVVGSTFHSNKRPVGRLPDKHIASSSCSDKKKTIVATRGEVMATASTNTSTNTKSSCDAIGLHTFRDKFSTFIEKVVHIVDPFTGKPIEEGYDGVHSGRILGKGISGNVRLIKHRTTGTKHAVKCVDLELFDDGDKRCMKQLKQEIKILCELDHPNIVRLESVYASHQNIYLVQELCLGGELFDRLDKQIDYCFPEGVCVRLVKQMLSAVRYLHDKGIIHRDLKLENFLLSSNDPTDCNIKLIDFGSSRHFRQGDIYDDVVGTPYTVAPEVILKCYDEKCDVWSIGVIAFMLLCGDAPFGGCGGPEPLSIVRANILSEHYAFEPYETWDLITDDCKDFIEDLLNVDPTYRPSAQQAQRHPWFEYWAAKGNNTTTNTNVNDTGLKPDVIQNLINFKEYSPLRRLLSEVLSFTLMPEQLADLRKEFEKIDTDGSGEIDFTTLMEALLTTNGKLSRSKEFAGRSLLRENDVGAIFDAMRVNKTEPKIRWHELVAAAFPPCQVDDRNFRHAFERLDSDHKGFVTLDDILDLVGRDERQNEEQLKPMWKESMKAINCNQQHIFYHQFLLLTKGQPEKQVENRVLNSPNASERKPCSSLTVVTETKSSNFAQFNSKQLNYSLEAPLSEDGDDVFLNSLPNIGIKDNASAKCEPPEKTLKVNANDHDEMKADSPMTHHGSDDSVKTDLIFDSSVTRKPTEESITEVNTTETCPSDQDDKSTYGSSDTDNRDGMNGLTEGSELLVESCEMSSREPMQMNNNAIDSTRNPSTSPVISDLSISVYQEPGEEESEISYAADDRNEISTQAALSAVEMRRINTAPVNDAEGMTTQSTLAVDQFHCHVRVADIDGSSRSTARTHQNTMRTPPPKALVVEAEKGAVTFEGCLQIPPQGMIS